MPPGPQPNAQPVGQPRSVQPESPSFARTGYRPDIDGLRAIAVLAVVLYHAGVPGITGGFVGVDVFFVISGFLITTLIVQQQDSQSFSLLNFYARRARRLFPALLVVLVTSALLAWLLLMPSEFEDFGESLATAAAFSSNILFWSEAGYFDGPSEFKPLLHTWSLAVEEQYYLVFPWLLIALARYAPTRPTTARIWLIGTLFLASLSLSAWYVHTAPSATFFLLPHRFWELLTGSALAVAVLQRPHWVASLKPAQRGAMALTGASALGFALFGFSSNTPFPGVNALLPCLGTALLILAGTYEGQSAQPIALSWPTRLLGTRPLVAVGLISYSLYLWHWPVLVFQKLWLIRPADAPEIAVALLASGLLAWISWRWIEQPLRHGYRHLSDAAVLRLTGLFSVFLITAGLIADQTDGLPQRLPAPVVATAEVADDKPPGRKRCTGIAADQVSASGLCRIGEGTAEPDFLVWGDSHAMTLIPQLAEVADGYQRVGLNATRNGCAALLGMHRPEVDPLGECEAFNSAVVALLKNNPNLHTVLLIGRWAIYAEGTRYKFESGKQLLALDAELAGEPDSLANNAAVTARSLQRTITTLAALERKPLILAGIPEVGWQVPTVLARAQLLERDVSIAPSAREHADRQARITPVLDALRAQGVRVFSPASILCPDPAANCQVAADSGPGQRKQAPLYIDEDHLSSLGAAMLKPLLAEMLAPSTGSKPDR